MLNMSCAQEKIELTNIKFGHGISDVLKQFKANKKGDWALSKDIKYYIIEENENLNYIETPITAVTFFTYKDKISKIILYVNSYNTQEKIFTSLEKKYGNMKPDFGNCPKENLVCWFHHDNDNDNVFISFPRLVEKQYKIKGVASEVEISDKNFYNELIRLEVENTERLKKEGKY